MHQNIVASAGRKCDAHISRGASENSLFHPPQFYLTASIYGNIKVSLWYLITGFPHILENLENNKFIFQVLDMSLNLTKSGHVLEKYIASE